MVYVPKLRTHAEVLEAPSRGQVRVAAGAMKLTVRVDELAQSPPGTAPPGPKRSKKTSRDVPPARRDETPVRTESTTCDVRGMRVDEALDRVEAFIDRLLSEGDPAGFILQARHQRAQERHPRSARRASVRRENPRRGQRRRRRRLHGALDGGVTGGDSTRPGCAERSGVSSRLKDSGRLASPGVLVGLGLSG